MSLRVVGAGLGRTGTHSLKVPPDWLLGVAVPDEPFPHVNSTAEARTMMGLDDVAASGPGGTPQAP